jgi:hypothetical protein
VLQMFIAVINENFDTTEEAKRSQQVGQYFQTTQGQRHVHKNSDPHQNTGVEETEMDRYL